VGEIIVWVVVGVALGVGMYMPARPPIGGIFGSIVAGILGAIGGGFLWRQFFDDAEGVEWVGSIVLSIIGAVVIVWILRRAAPGTVR
jgi:uncharacterized membrane protein YeaQ/YmgE (transglycosylase-associated protein family)